MSGRKRKSSKKTDGIEKIVADTKTKPRKKRAKTDRKSTERPKVVCSRTIPSGSVTTTVTTEQSSPQQQQQQQQQEQLSFPNNDIDPDELTMFSQMMVRHVNGRMFTMHIPLSSLFGANEPGENELEFLCDTFRVDHTKAAKVLVKCGGNMDRATDYLLERGKKSEERMKRESEKLAREEKEEVAARNGGSSSTTTTATAATTTALVSSSDCKICYNTMGEGKPCSVIVLVPCGHVVCNKCSLRMETCPFCKSRIDRRVKPFF